MLNYLFKKSTQYFKNILLGVDLLVNAITGGNPRETVSMRLGRWKSKSKLAKAICNVMSKTLFNKLHCERAFKEPGKGEPVNDNPVFGLVVLIIIVTTVFTVY